MPDDDAAQEVLDGGIAALQTFLRKGALLASETTCPMAELATAGARLRIPSRHDLTSAGI